MSNNNQYNDNQNQYDNCSNSMQKNNQNQQNKKQNNQKITSRATRRTRTSRNITFSLLSVCGYFHKDAVIRRRISGRWLYFCLPPIQKNDILNGEQEG